MNEFLSKHEKLQQWSLSVSHIVHLETELPVDDADDADDDNVSYTSAVTTAPSESNEPGTAHTKPTAKRGRKKGWTKPPAKEPERKSNRIRSKSQSQKKAD